MSHHVFFTQNNKPTMKLRHAPYPRTLEICYTCDCLVLEDNNTGWEKRDRYARGVHRFVLQQKTKKDDKTLVLSYVPMTVS